MIRSSLIIVVLFVVGIGLAEASAPSGEAPKRAKRGVIYGVGVSAGERMSLHTAMMSKAFGRTIRITGKAIEVCQVKGCWMILQDRSSKVRVTFKDYGFFMPENIVGRRIALEGVLSLEVLSEKDARHYAEDAGKSKRDIEAIVGDQNEYSFEATGVVVL